MKDYRVGQILFLIANNSVIPVQIIEEVIRTTLTGKEKTHIVKFPDKDQSTSDISKIKGQLFLSKEEVRKFMIENATNAIDEMILKSDELTIIAFNVNPQEEEKSILEVSDNLIDGSKMQNDNKDNIIKVDLGNGKFGKIKTNELEKAGGLKWKYFY